MGATYSTEAPDALPQNAVAVYSRPRRAEQRGDQRECLRMLHAEFPHDAAECPTGLVQVGVSPAEWAGLMGRLNEVAAQQQLTYLAPLVIARRMLVVESVLLITFIISLNVWSRAGTECWTENGRTVCGRPARGAAMPVFIAALAGLFGCFIAGAILMIRAARREAQAAVAVARCVATELQPALAGRGVTVELGEVHTFQRRARGVAGRPRTVRRYVRFTLPPGFVAQPLMRTAGIVPQQPMMMMMGPGPVHPMPYGQPGQPTLVPLAQAPHQQGQGQPGGAQGGGDGIPVAMPLVQAPQGQGAQAYPAYAYAPAGYAPGYQQQQQQQQQQYAPQYYYAQGAPQQQPAGAPGAGGYTVAQPPQQQQQRAFGTAGVAQPTTGGAFGTSGVPPPGKQL